MSLNDKIPPSLLLLSRVFYLPEDITFADRMKTILAQLPEGIAEQTRQKLTEIEGGHVDYKERLNLLQSIENQLADERTLAKKIAASKREKEMADSVSAKMDKEKETKAIEKALETVEAKAHAIKVSFPSKRPNFRTTLPICSRLKRSPLEWLKKSSRPSMTF